MRKTISIFANIAILSFYIYFIVVKWDVFRNLLDIRIHYLLILTILIILTWFANAFQAKLLLDFQGVKIGLFKNVLLICASVLGNHLPFRLGTLYRMHYLKKNFNVNYQQFGSIIVFRFLLLIVLTGMIGILCVGYIYYTYQRFNIGFCLLMIGFVVLPLGATGSRKHICSIGCRKTGSGKNLKYLTAASGCSPITARLCLKHPCLFYCRSSSLALGFL